MVSSVTYVKESLGPDEEIIHIGNFHWMYTVSAILAIVWGVILCVAVLIGAVFVQQHFLGGMYSDSLLGQIRELHPLIRLFAFLMFIMGLLRFAQMMIVKVTTEIAITNSRLIYKRGLVARHVGEMSIDRIEGVNVLQGIIGRILNYGRVMIRGMGVGEVVLPPIEDPVNFRRMIEKAKNY